MRAVAACFGSVSGASRYDRSWPRLRARHTSGLMANKGEVGQSDKDVAVVESYPKRVHHWRVHSCVVAFGEVTNENCLCSGGRVERGRCYGLRHASVGFW